MKNSLKKMKAEHGEKVKALGKEITAADVAICKRKR